MKNIQFIFIAICGLVVFGCSPSSGEFQGNEYMPDMGHSVAYEANYYDYYRYNRWGGEADYYAMAQPRNPVQGTIPRGYAGAGASLSKYAMLRGMNSLNAIATPPNGSVPYYYEDTEAERTRATNEIIENPFPITTAGLAQGKTLYDIYCGICHGKKGDGNGYLVADENAAAAYPAQPAILTSEEFITATNGRYYHAIMHGKNVMGGYADKLSYEERWQVIHYIRALQAKSNKTEYSQTANTLNDVGRPAGANYSREISLNADGGNWNVGAGGHTSGSHGAGNIHGGNMHGGSHGGTHTIQGVQHGTMQGGVHSTTHMQDAIAVPGTATGAKKEKKIKKLLKKAGEKIKEGGGKVKDGTKKVGGKIKNAFKKKDAGDGGH